jgi:hypothetical protein
MKSILVTLIDILDAFILRLRTVYLIRIQSEGISNYLDLTIKRHREYIHLNHPNNMALASTLSEVSMALEQIGEYDPGTGFRSNKDFDTNTAKSLGKNEKKK